MPWSTVQLPAALARPAIDPAATPGPVFPLLSMVPGLVCWLLFASAAMPGELPVLDRLASLLGARTANAAVVGTWLLAVGTSVYAAIHYGRRTQAWYTTLCIAFHLAGLVFSLLLVGGLAVLLVA